MEDEGGGGIFLRAWRRLIVISNLQRHFNTLRQHDIIHNMVSDIADGDRDTIKRSN